jgi:hypothetical protein
MLEIRTYGAQPLNEANNKDGNVAFIGRQRRKKSGDYVGHHGSPDNPLCRVFFSDSSTGNLTQYVAPEVRSQYQTLNWFGPNKRPILYMFVGIFTA